MSEMRQPHQAEPIVSVLVAIAVVAFGAGVYYATSHNMLVLLTTGFGSILMLLLMASDLRLAVVLAVFSIPLEDFFVLGSTGTITKLITAGLAGSYVFYLARGRLRPRWDAVSKVGWLWLIWAATSLFWSASPQVGQLTSLLQLVVLAFIIAAIVAERPVMLPMILWTYALSACTIAVLGIARFLADVQTLGPVRTSAGEGQGVEHFAAYLLPALIFLVLLGLRHKQHWVLRLVVYTLVAVLVLGLLISGTRSAWVGALAALTVVIVPSQRRRGQVTLVAIVLALAVGVTQVPGVVSFVAERATDTLSDGGAGRLDIWKVGLGIASESPLIGVGFANFPENFGVREIQESPFGLEHQHLFIGRAPHSIYLGILSELGLIGFALFIAWILPVLFGIPGSSIVALAIRGAFVAYLVQGMYLDILNRKYFWLVLGLAEGFRLALARKEGQWSSDAVADPVDCERLPQPG